jgi:hypothetical protein
MIALQEHHRSFYSALKVVHSMKKLANVIDRMYTFSGRFHLYNFEVQDWWRCAEVEDLCGKA